MLAVFYRWFLAKRPLVPRGSATIDSAYPLVRSGTRCMLVFRGEVLPRPVQNEDAKERTSDDGKGKGGTQNVHPAQAAAATELVNP